MILALLAVLALAVPEAGEADSPAAALLEHAVAWWRAW